jgi:hypothetical protein
VTGKLDTKDSPGSQASLNHSASTRRGGMLATSSARFSPAADRAVFAIRPAFRGHNAAAQILLLDCTGPLSFIRAKTR